MQAEPASVDFALPNHNITIVGAFNPMIVRPDWVLRNIRLPGTDIETLFPTEPLEGPVFHRSSDITWFTNRDRLVVFSADPAHTMAFAQGILEKLPETPLAGAGVNFQFKQSASGVRLPGWREASTAATTDVDGGQLLSVQFTQRILRPDGVQLQVQLVRNAGADELVVEFNFHSSPKGTDEKDRSRQLRDHVLRAGLFKSEAEKILRRL